MSIEVGQVVEGTVTGITNFGAFIELPGGKVGLVHISEVADVYVRDVKDFLKERDKVKVKVLSIDGNGKIGLSIKQLQPPSENRRPPAFEGRRTGPPPFEGRRMGPPEPRRPLRPVAASFEDRLSKFLKDSDERLTDLKKATDSKRGGRGSRRSD